MKASFSDRLRTLRKTVEEQIGTARRTLAEQFDPQDIAAKLEDALLGQGWHFSEVTVPNKSKGEIIIRGTKDNTFLDISVTYREDMADVEVSRGQIENITDISDPEEIVQTVMGLAGGEISSASSALRSKEKVQSEGDVVPGWLRLRNRPAKLGI